ncbi:hypothetical protein [Chryseobacterium indologenes]|uniref:hypothetical protein n=1 Tax=Chryseobacterium indologenes TaxID=253 RepID=UPI0010244BD8|nr:hypothetical protein [Chryseobacterium indologenes]VFA43754.1 Uncharacterised protein [Chryseobacterium indologenes]
MKKYTKYLFFFSVSMSAMTLIIQEIGYKEIYPFSGWKLFTIPAAGEKSMDRYKLYGVKDGDTIRILNKKSESYEANDEEGIVYVYGEKIERNEERAENIKKLLIFAKDTRPEFQKYLLYKETYNPREIGLGKVNLYKKLITGL